jgi:multicomponent Na+:H+ antiporter subunit G
MNNALTITGAIITLAGSLFLLVSATGILRMPDAFTRIQAGTKSSTLGTILTLAGLILVHPEWAGKLVLLILFILLTNPVSSHVLARAAHYIRTSMTRLTEVDKLRSENGGLNDTDMEKAKQN